MKLQKETKMAREGAARRHGRWYGDACGTAFGLEVLGERWAMLIVRELLLGPRRFSDLRASLPGISAKVLTERLDGLAGWGVLERRQLPPPASAQIYELTDWGRAAEPAIMELGRWAALSTRHDPMLPLSTASLMTSMKTMQLPALAEAPDMRIGMRIGGENHVVGVENGAFFASREEPADVDGQLVAGDARPIAAALYGDMPLDAVRTQFGLELHGDRNAIDRFIGLFALPPKIG